MVVVIISIVVNLACPAPKVILCGSKRGTSGWKIWVHYHPVGCVDTVSWWSVLSLQQYKFYIPTSVHHPQCPAAGFIITMHSVMPWPHHHHHYYHHQHLVYLTSSSWWSRLAPWVTRSLAMSKWPPAAARCKAVWPVWGVLSWFSIRFSFSDDIFRSELDV